MNSRQPIKPDSISGSAAMLKPVAVQQMKPKIGTSGNHGVRNFSSLALRPCLSHWRRKLNWLQQMLIQTITMVKAATPIRFLKITSAPNCSDSRPGRPPIMVTQTATTGTPDLLTLAKTRGSWFCAESAHIMREAA